MSKKIISIIKRKIIITRESEELGLVLKGILRENVRKIWEWRDGRMKGLENEIGVRMRIENSSIYKAKTSHFLTVGIKIWPLK